MSRIFQRGFEFLDGENRQQILENKLKIRQNKSHPNEREQLGRPLRRCLSLKPSFALVFLSQRTEKRGEGQPGAVGAQAAFKDSSAESVCRHPSLIYYGNEGNALVFTFMLPHIWFSLNLR